MRKQKILLKFMPSACVAAMLMAAVAVGQSAKSTLDDSTKAAMYAKQLKPQTTCPVMGGAIDKNLYVDYNGKRIYVCCADCIDKVNKNPEKYIKKLKSLGQSVETVPDKTKKESKDVKADTSMKGMDHGKMKM